MKKISTVAGLVLSTSIASVASANEGYYGSLQIGHTEVMSHFPGDYGAAFGTVSAKASVGYRKSVAQDFSISGEIYHTMRDFDPLDVWYTPTAAQDQTGFNIRAGGDNEKIWNYLSVGYSRLTYVSGNPFEDVYRNGLELGFGTEVQVAPKMAIRADFKWFDDFTRNSQDVSNALVFSLGASYYFTADENNEMGSSDYSFEGYYLGLSGSANSLSRDSSGENVAFTNLEGGYGAYGGYTKQFDNGFTLGGELAFDKFCDASLNTGGPPIDVASTLSLSARLGFASGKNHVYLGAGIVRANYANNVIPNEASFDYGPQFSMGIEQFVSENISARVEYVHSTFSQPGYDFIWGNFENQKVKFGLTYNFPKN